jgi:hypothetical protein
MGKAIDSITEGPGLGGAVVLNYGDPAYRLGTGSASGLGSSERIFIRLLAYLMFAEDVCIPVRHILEGSDMSKAVEWAAPLLDQGLIVPTQRIDSSSFEEYARQRSLADASMRRAEFLDLHAVRTRRFHYKDLSEAYRQVLVRDLDANGCFRRTVRGGIRGRYGEALSAACREFSSQREGTPDAFTSVVSRHSPDLSKHARQWAMARYYVTPVLESFDTVHTREVPNSAGKLLAKGGVFTDALPLLEENALPISIADTRLQASMPVNSIASNSQRYCNALLEVRREVPEARLIFADVGEGHHLSEASEEVSSVFRREFYRQLRSRPTSGRTFTLVSSLLGSLAGSGVGFIAGTDPLTGTGVGVAVGIGTGMVTNEIQNRFEARHDRKSHPWSLAMDRLEARIADG